MSPKDAEGMSDSEDPDRSSLIWVYTVCPCLSENWGSLQYTYHSWFPVYYYIGATFDLEEEYQQSQADLLAEFEKRKRVILFIMPLIKKYIVPFHIHTSLLLF